MKFLVVLLLSCNNLFSFNNYFIDNNDTTSYEETKEVVNNENRNGMLIGLVGCLVITEIILLYKKKKIKL